MAFGLDWNVVRDTIDIFSESTGWKLITNRVDILLGEGKASGVHATYEELAYLEFDGENQVIIVNHNVAKFKNEFGLWQLANLLGLRSI